MLTREIYDNLKIKYFNKNKFLYVKYKQKEFKINLNEEIKHNKKLEILYLNECLYILPKSIGSKPIYVIDLKNLVGYEHTQKTYRDKIYELIDDNKIFDFKKCREYKLNTKISSTYKLIMPFSYNFSGIFELEHYLNFDQVVLIITPHNITLYDPTNNSYNDITNLYKNFLNNEVRIRTSEEIKYIILNDLIYYNFNYKKMNLLKSIEKKGK